MTGIVRLASCDVVLARRSRYGDRGAARRLAARHLDRISLLASVVSTSPDQATDLARQGFSLALRGARPFEDALVTAFGRLAATLPDAEAAHGRLLLLLVEVEQQPADVAARLLGLEPDAVASLLPAARATAGAAHPYRSCRGWGLVSRRSGLTHAEHKAGRSHLILCRRCRDRLAALDRTRAHLLGGSAGVVGVVAAAQLVPLGGSAAAGAGGLVTGKAAVALVAALGAGVLATGGTTAIVQQTHHRAPVTRPAPASTPVAHDPVTSPAPPAPRSACGLACAPSTAPAPTSTSLPSRSPVRVPTTAPTPGLPLPLPLPVPLPIPLPTGLPDLPGLPLPIPLPSLVASLLNP